MRSDPVRHSEPSTPRSDRRGVLGSPFFCPSLGALPYARLLVGAERACYAAGMASIKRTLSLLAALALTAALTACSPIRVSDEATGCPPEHVQLDIHGVIEDAAGNEIPGRPYVLTVAAQSYDPEYQGIYVVGTGVSGRNPIVRDAVSETDEPTLCIPEHRAVAIMVRMAMQNPAAALERIECQLIDRGVDGTGGAGPVALDALEVELTDLMPGQDRDRWYVAQCDWLYVPPGFGGQVPDLFPRPDGQ